MSTSHGVAKGLGASLCLASLLALSAPTASATTTAISCSEIDTGVVSCVLPDGVSQYNTTALLSAAQQYTQTTLTTSTPLVITAYGGAGRQGDNGGGLYSGGNGGNGGRAQTVTSVADFQGTFGSNLYYYVGQLGGTSAGGRGGSSTLVSGVDLTTTQPCIAGYASCTTTNLLADGAGGGGGGEGNANGDGGYGGDGGTAVSGQIISLGSQGRDGRAATGTLTRTGQGGFGGGNGDGGSGGRGGSGVSSHPGTDGQDGIGGLGGPTHTSKGPNAGVAWTNNSSLSFGSAGQGGEGEWRVNATNYGGGGGGGGGWGGGGGGGGGGEAITGGGGGGGGSWASSDTETVQSVPVISNPDSGGNGSVIATFVGSSS